MVLAEPQPPELFFPFILVCLDFCNFLKLLGFTVNPLIQTWLLPVVQPTLLPCTLLYTSTGRGEGEEGSHQSQTAQAVLPMDRLSRKPFHLVREGLCVKAAWLLCLLSGYATVVADPSEEPSFPYHHLQKTMGTPHPVLLMWGSLVPPSLFLSWGDVLPAFR